MFAFHMQGGAGEDLMLHRVPIEHLYTVYYDACELSTVALGCMCRLMMIECK